MSDTVYIPSTESKETAQPSAVPTPPPSPAPKPSTPPPLPHHPLPPPPQKRNGCFQGCLIFSFIFMLIIVACTVVFVITNKNNFSKTTNTNPQVLCLNLNGPISFASEAKLFSEIENNSVSVLNAIREATHDASVRGILLSIDSGGGEITASDIIWNALNDFKAEGADRAVVVLMGGIAASGAYYISCAADTIIAHPTTMTGSIGVKIESYNAKALADKIGIKSVTIASGENKDFLNPLKDLAPEQQAILQKMVNSLHERFVTIVTDSRNLETAKVRAIADGRVLLAQEALDAGLIDAIGYKNDAAEYFTDYFGENPSFIEPKRNFWDLIKSPSFLGEVLSRAAAASASSVETRLIIK